MRTQIPKFRLPDVGDRRGGRLHPRSRRRVPRRASTSRSMKALLDEGFDAVFVGSGAPRGRDLDIPGRREAAKNIHIGIDWLSSVSFGHVDKIGKRVVVLGGGNTAMDCCRSARRLGGEEVHVVVRSGFDEMKASPWEKEDAMHEGIPIHNFLVPKAFLHDNGKLTGIAFDKVEARYDDERAARAGAHRRAGGRVRMRRRAGRRRPGERVPVDRARRRHRVRQVGHADRRSRDDDVDAARRVLRRRRGVRPEEHHLGGRARSRRGDLDRQALPRRRPAAAPAADVPAHLAEDGHPRVELRQRDHARQAPQGAAQGHGDRAEEHQGRGRARLRREARVVAKRSAASTATCRRCSPTSSASNAMPASTSARWTASRSPRTARRASCARGCTRRR